MNPALVPLRLHLLALLGLPLLAACPESPGDSASTCGDDLARYDDPSEAAAAGTGLSCFAEPEGGCPDYTDVAFETVAHDNDTACGVEGEVTCGPDTSEAGTCCYAFAVTEEWCAGRPFAPTGTPRHADRGPTAWADALTALATALAPDLRAELARGWRQVALDEHASIASFARFSLQLLALGAPPELVAEAARAQADEVRHARAAFGVAAALGDAGGVGALDVSGGESVDPATVLREVFLGGCVGETLAAAVAGVARDEASSPVLRGLLDTVAREETRHAVLAWQTVRWLLTTNPGLRETLPALLAEVEALTGGPPTASVRGWGLLVPSQQAALVRDTLRQVVAPTANALGAREKSRVPAESVTTY